jgi:adenylate kinase family enzyme
MQRVTIFGLPGSGKSTLAVRMASKLQLPVYHLDKYFFVGGWVERDRDEFLAIQEGLVSQPAWVIDGNARHSLEMRYARSDLVIYMQLNRLLCLWRLLWRAIRPDTEIEDLPSGCSKGVRWRLIRYMWTFDSWMQTHLTQLQAKYPQVRLLVLKNRGQVAELDSVGGILA